MAILAALITVLGWVLLFTLVSMVVVGQRRLRALAWGGGLPGSMGALPVVEVPADEAPRGWKAAQVLCSPDGRQLQLAGISVGGCYSVEDRAVCVRGHPHAPPDLGCACGFYALRRRRDAVSLLARRFGLGGGVVARTLLEVDLAGTVIEHDDGFRAEAQRVLAIRLLPWCATCAGLGIMVAATCLATDGRPALPATAWGPYATSVVHESQAPLREWPALRPSCAGCADRIEAPGRTLSLPQVAAALGTEVSWLDAAEVAPARVLASHRQMPTDLR